jgi:hypothetical protein
MNKKQFYSAFKGASVLPNENTEQYLQLVRNIEQQYFNLFCAAHLIKGDGITDELKRYMYKRFWLDGTICLFNINHTDLLGACQYAASAYDMYSEPAEVQPVYINPTTQQEIPLVPHKTLVVNKDCVIGWYQRNHMPMHQIVHKYAERIADIEMTINTNIQLHKIPFMFNSTDGQAAKRLKDALQSILNNQTVVGIAQADLEQISVLNMSPAYIVDKLQAYKVDLENELKTYLGLQNTGAYQKGHILESEVESSRANTKQMQANFDDELQEFSKRVKDVLGKTITFECRQVESDIVEHKDPKVDAHPREGNNE